MQALNELLRTVTRTLHNEWALSADSTVNIPDSRAFDVSGGSYSFCWLAVKRDTKSTLYHLKLISGQGQGVSWRNSLQTTGQASYTVIHTHQSIAASTMKRGREEDEATHASSSSPTSLTIISPDDWHHHLRDGPALADVVAHAANSFRRVVAMPNLKPPVKKLADAIAYKERIMECVPEDKKSSFEALMTLYLTDTTTAEDVLFAKQSGIVHAVKLYPAGATTNSEHGVTSLAKVTAVLRAMAVVGMPLLIHGEVTDTTVDVYDREKVFIDTILRPLITEHPSLRVVMEHITTKHAVDFVMSCGPNIAATITAHHLLYNRNAIFKNGICPHMVSACLWV